MEFRLLGPLEVAGETGSVSLGGPRQRQLLAVLLLRANEVVPRDVLTDALWPERLPENPRHSLDVQISRLRGVLAEGAALSRNGEGYMLEVDPRYVDSATFELLLADGRLDAALALWRGAVLADVAIPDVVRPEVERLEELRLGAIEDQADARLALGEHDAVVAELESLVAKHPYRERLRAELMLALYRSGRQTKALEVYADGRRRLSEDLGLEPAPALRELERSILEHDPALALRSTPSRARRRKLAVVGAAIVAALAAGAGVLLSGGGLSSSRAEPSAEPDAVAFLAVGSGKIFGQAPARATVLARFGAGALWSVSLDGEVTRVDPVSGRVTATVDTGVTHPAGLAVGNGSVWVTDCCSPTLVRIDPATNVVADRIRLPTAQHYLAVQTGDVATGAGSVWVSQGFANPSYVLRLDPSNGRVVKSIRIPQGGAQSLAFGDGALWVAGPNLGYLSKIDPATNSVVADERSLHSWLCCVAAGGGYAWAALNPDDTIWKIDGRGQVLASIKLPQAIESMTYADGEVWVADGEAGDVVRIDPATDATKRYRLGHHLIGLAVQRGVLAVGVQRSGSDAVAALHGDVVRIALDRDSIDSVDPVMSQNAFNPAQTEFHYATCAKLLNYPDAPGNAGRRLVPEVAAAWPRVSDGGRTYSFRIRRGFGFSPPSHEQVTAQSFAHAIERNLSPKLPGQWDFALFHDIAGAAAFHAGRADRVRGVVTHGDRLVIHLVRAAPDFPSRLALPQSCAVPAALPVVAGGLDGPIPSAGPYYAADRVGNVIVLRRNPNYHGHRPRHADAIVYDWDVAAGPAAKRVDQGRADVLSTLDPALAPTTAVARAARARYRIVPQNWTELLALNPRRPLFSNTELRQLVARTLDRRALATSLDVGFGSVPTSSILSPNLVDSSSPSLYPLNGRQRVALARRRVARVAVHADADGNIYDVSFVEELTTELARLGIRARIVPIRQTDSPTQLEAQLSRVDIAAVQRNASQTVDVVDYLRSLPYLPDRARTALDRIDSGPYERRATAAAAVAADLERSAVYLGFAYDALPELVSRRLGCTIDHPVYNGLDVAALCVRP